MFPSAWLQILQRFTISYHLQDKNQTSQFPWSCSCPPLQPYLLPFSHTYPKFQLLCTPWRSLKSPKNLYLVRTGKVKSIQLHVMLVYEPVLQLSVWLPQGIVPKPITCFHNIMDLSFTAFITTIGFTIIWDYFIHLFLHTDCKLQQGRKYVYIWDILSNMSPVQVSLMLGIQQMLNEYLSNK